MATATKADGWANGELGVTIRDSTLRVEGALSGWLDGDADQGDE